MLFPWTTTTPWLLSAPGVAMVDPFSARLWPAPITSVPPVMVDVFRVSAARVSAVLNAAVTELRTSAPLPPSVPAF